MISNETCRRRGNRTWRGRGQVPNRHLPSKRLSGGDAADGRRTIGRMHASRAAFAGSRFTTAYELHNGHCAPPPSCADVNKHRHMYRL
ncbi:hypothetical protein EVAR_41258_1 [Eumeta japonica]|uniref:Uncharacterized protein n=1 Tax=Eumeta variegata TaxID=151549 RepID=A0A4C1W369_EUMVA|nr:hypothetical protein EVAR_41258_1 [Eumeta japonica]